MRIIMTLAVSLLLGVIPQLFLLPGNIGFLLGGGLAFLGFILFLAARKKCLRLVLICYGLAVGLLWAGGYEYLKVDPVLRYDGIQMPLTAEVTEYSGRTPYGTDVTARVELEERSFQAVLYLDGDLSLKPGDRISGSFLLRDSHDSGNYSYYSDGIFLRGYQRDEITVRYGEKIPFRYCHKWMAKSLEKALLASFPEDVWGYAVALTTGNRDYLSDGEIYDLKTAGCYHALALSGMHLVVLASLVIAGQKKKKWLKLLISLPACALFTLLTGLTPSMVRAFVMMVFVYLAPVLRRESDSLTNLSLACLVLMLENPWCIASWGLQLSFAATLGIILFSARLLKWFREKTSITRHMKVRYFVVNSLSLTFSALFLTVPLQMTYFGYVSIVAPIANILTSAVIDVCFGGSLIIGIIGLIFAPLGELLGWVLAWAFRYVKMVMALFADIPFAAVYTDVFYVVLWLILCYGIVCAMLLWPGQRKIIPVCSMLSALAVLLCLTTLDSRGFVFTALDVGQGQCLVLRSGGGTVMVDCGGKRSGEIAADYLGSLCETGVDLLIVTHYDNDHIGGIADLMERRRVDKLMLPDIPSERRYEILELAQTYNTEGYFCRQDQNVYCGDTKLQVFSPVGMGESNESGLSVLASGKKMDVLITGDMEMGTELLLLKNHDLPDVEVLVAGHHGSRDSTSKILLEQVKPEIVVVSVGENNYGHPHEETLERIAAAKAKLLRTDLRGTVTLKEAS